MTLLPTVTSGLLDWLLDSDPSLRWQVERDLVGAPEPVWRQTRARVAVEGLGSELLSYQDEDGLWAGGAYFPVGHRADEPGQPWTATTWSLNTLREWGVPASALRPGTVGLLERNAHWEYDGLPYWDGEVDACINAFTLANGAWLGADVSRIEDWFPANVLQDGGWNCMAIEDGSTRSSFHSTLNVIIGLLEHEVRTGGTDRLRALRHGAEEYLMSRDLMCRLSTGEVHEPWAVSLAYPYRWYYSVLRAADHFRAASVLEGRAPDPRMVRAIERLRADRDPDGTWHQGLRHQGRVWFEVDSAVGEPSRWLTFHALRVLQWWDEHPW